MFAVHRVIAIAKRKSTASVAHRTRTILTVADDSGSSDMNIERFLEFLRIRQPHGHGALRGPARRGRPSAKPLKAFGGARVMEIVDRHDTNTYRAVYTAEFGGAIYVLHAFQKGVDDGHRDAEARDRSNPRVRLS